MARRKGTGGMASAGLYSFCDLRFTTVVVTLPLGPILIHRELSLEGPWRPFPRLAPPTL